MRISNVKQLFELTINLEFGMFLNMIKPQIPFWCVQNTFFHKLHDVVCGQRNGYQCGK